MKLAIKEGYVFGIIQVYTEGLYIVSRLIVNTQIQHKLIALGGHTLKKDIALPYRRRGDTHKGQHHSNGTKN